MVTFFKKDSHTIYAVESDHRFSDGEKEQLCWLFAGATVLTSSIFKGPFVGPRKEMITPWSTNAVEITQNMGLKGITRIECFNRVKSADAPYDKMLYRLYQTIGKDVFKTDKTPDPIVYIQDISAYNESEGLALSAEEEEYLRKLSQKLGRPLTDSEVFGFSQVNSEHCRHKIFNGVFVIDGQEKPVSLFKLIKRTSQENPNGLVSAYKDNVAFVSGPRIEQFAPANPDKPDYFTISNLRTVISLKAETHNFPTTVEPFNGAATGTGGEIRDRLGGGKASLPIAGTAVYMTSYPRIDDCRSWENAIVPRQWLYQSPVDILIKASNGASDFGNKFGQPLICGSVLTFEHEENGKTYAYDKVIMLAGGVGFAARKDAIKGEPEPGEKVVLLGGDNYRIGMGGGAVSSVATGQYAGAIELNAVQRANPEMQKRVANVIRALAESGLNPIISIHDHGAGGHLNALSELVEATGGHIDINALPIGDHTLSYKEIVGNESQERMGMVVKAKDIPLIQRIADRERAPMYVVGETTDDHKFVFEDENGVKPIDLEMDDMFGNSPRTIMEDHTVTVTYSDAEYSQDKIEEYLQAVLSLESVACKDWLTNKVDRSVTGRVARQQCQGEIQLPLSDCGVVALDYRGRKGIATALGHAPQAGLASPEAGSVLSVAEALTNIVWAPLAEGLDSISLSANWMWPCRSQKGEDARLYSAVRALSDFCCSLQINVPTGKDSLSLSQQYPNGEKIISPGTVIVSAGGEVSDIRKVVSPVLVNDKNASLYHIDFSFDSQKLGGSAFAQSLGKVGDNVPTVTNPEYFRDAFNAVQEMIDKGWIMAGHDISAGGLITTLLEMCFANTTGGMHINLHNIAGDMVTALFAENPGVVVEVSDSIKEEFQAFMDDCGVGYAKIGYSTPDTRTIVVKKGDDEHTFDIDALRDVWYTTSYKLDRKQSFNGCADERFANYKHQPLEMAFNTTFTGKLSQYGISADRRTPSGVKAAIIREKGTNGEREMAYSLYLAGFDVKDVMMTDLITGRETLDDINMIVFCGGFSNSDVLGSAKGWAGAFLYNPKAKEALDRFYSRPDTLSLGICNGCQLMVELGLVGNEDVKAKAHMLHNNSHKFESEFISLTIPQNNSVMFGSLSGNKLGIWVAHGEGKFSLPDTEDKYSIVAKYNYAGYPGNPNGSDYNVAGICSRDGRHLAMMPHLERAVFPWQNAWYPLDRRNDEVTPWIEAFVNARLWIERYR